MINEATLKTLLSNTPEMVDILQTINQLNLPDTWLCAGILRNFIWNYLSDQPLFDAQTDVDVVFFDPEISYEATLELEKNLKSAFPDDAWELKNQAHMHLHNPNVAPYLNTRDAIAKFPERCTAIGARLNASGEIDLFIPYGLADIVNFIVRPTPFFMENEERLAIYRERVARKNWQEKWPQLHILVE